MIVRRCGTCAAFDLPLLADQRSSDGQATCLRQESQPTVLASQSCSDWSLASGASTPAVDDGA